MATPLDEIARYIEQAARARGIDPNIALRVARSEGLAPGVWQSALGRNGRREPSFGPFQLLKGGPGTGYPTGLGNAFAEKTGLDPADPANLFPGIDFALDTAAQDGWRQWYGAAKAGVGRWDGVRGARATGVKPSMTPEAANFVKNNPQPGGYGPEVEAAVGGQGNFPAQPAMPAPTGGFSDIFAALAPNMKRAGADMQAPAGVEPPSFGSGDPMGGPMAAMQGASNAKGLLSALMPDIERMLSLGKRPVLAG